MNADIASLTPQVIQLALQLISLGHGPAGLVASALFTFLSDGGLQKLISAFQAFHKLPVTGKVDGPTQALLARPRCAHPDCQADTQLYRWLDGNLTWSQAVNLPTVPTEVIASAFEAAWSEWAKVCGITPTQKSAAEAQLANVVASAGEGPDLGFDAANQILALSQLPTGIPLTAQLTQVFNRRSSWTNDMVQAVVAHEIGHSIGLVHDAPGTLMYAYYTPGINAPTPSDIAQAVARYGPSQLGSKPSSPTSPASPGNVTIEINVPTAGPYLLTLAMKPK